MFAFGTVIAIGLVSMIAGGIIRPECFSQFLSRCSIFFHPDDEGRQSC
jgi:hypothetical protein